MILTDDQAVAPSRTEKPSAEIEMTTITFVAYKPRTQQPITLRPCQDSTGKLYTGQGQHGYYETLSQQEKADLPVVFDHNTTFVVSDGKTLNLKDPHDKAMWKWIQKHPYIAIDKESRGRDAVYYVANPTKEAKQRVDKTSKIDTARYKVRELSNDELSAAAKVLGLPAPQSFQPAELLDWMLAKSTTSPEAVLEAIDPANKSRNNARVFFNDAIRWKVLERIAGSYFYGGPDGISLGHTEDMAIEYLLTPENIERVQAMRTMLLEKRKSV